MTRIPLDIVVTDTGETTSGVIVAVMAAELDRVEAENAHLRNATFMLHRWQEMHRHKRSTLGDDTARLLAEIDRWATPGSPREGD